MHGHAVNQEASYLSESNLFEYIFAVFYLIKMNKSWHLTRFRLIQHTKALMNSDEKLCIKVLRTLQEMLIREMDFDEKVSKNIKFMGKILLLW